MAHNHEKKALYEVISKATWHNTCHDKTLEPPPQQMEELRRSEHPIAKLAAPPKARWLNRPRIVQVNAGRVEISIPYQVAIALLLSLILVVLIAFRLGQGSKKIAGSDAKTPATVQKAAPKAAVGAPQAAGPVREKTPVAQKVEPVTIKPKGDNRIVIQSYQFSADLEPVKQYFAQFGVETEIRKIDAWYYLVTRNKYENPGKPGTDGYLAKQKIIELGAKYKAPAGYETFGTKPFSDAYGKKFND